MGARYDNIAGVQHKVSKRYDNINGVWRPVSKRYNNIAGVWRQSYSGEIRWTHVIDDGYGIGIYPNDIYSCYFTKFANYSSVSGKITYTFEEPFHMHSGDTIVCMDGGAYVRFTITVPNTNVEGVVWVGEINQPKGKTIVITEEVDITSVKIQIDALADFAVSQRHVNVTLNTSGISLTLNTTDVFTP